MMKLSKFDPLLRTSGISPFVGHFFNQKGNISPFLGLKPLSGPNGEQKNNEGLHLQPFQNKVINLPMNLHVEQRTRKIALSISVSIKLKSIVS